MKQGREIMQIKCVEKFKFERSCKVEREIDWQEAFEIWVDEGFASVFERCYHESVHFAELYDEVMGA